MACHKNTRGQKLCLPLEVTGTPICTDQFTNKHKFDTEFGHYVRVSVDLDLKKDPIYRVLVEIIGYAFSWI